MIANLNIKNCPFKKWIGMTHYELAGQGFPINTVYEETFMECEEDKCMAWDDKEHKCLLCRKEVQ